jgi:F-type H+-transporting ATPase subunit delta
MRRREVIAKRYARALFLLAREAGVEARAGQELQAASEIIASHRELKDFLLHPWIQGATKKSAVAAIAERAQCSRLVTDFLGLLALRGRMDHLSEIMDVYQHLLDEAQGQARAEVRSAVALRDEERQALSRGLSRAVGRHVLVEDTVDPTLLGGFVARIGSLVLDGSVEGQLARLRERLVRG